MLFEREGGGGTYFPFFTEGVGAFSGLGRVGRGLIRTTALTRRQMASLKVRLKEPYLKFKWPAQLTRFVTSSRCNYASVYVRYIMHSPFRRRLSFSLVVSCFPS